MNASGLPLLADVATLAGRVHLGEQLPKALHETLSASLPCLSVNVGNPEGGRAGLATQPDLRQRYGAERVLVCPGSRGEKTILVALGPRYADRIELDEPLAEALARTIGALLDNTAIVERLADVSRRAHVENRLLKTELKGAERPVAVSASMRRALELADLVAREQATVLLRGETGTGKEVLARRIHALSLRSARPLLKVNCGALPETLIESALFGHERGAFTGANQRHIGLFERANGGTLFLDEVAELSPSVQVKLLRILQEGELERVGGSDAIQVSVRVIAATHRNMEEMIGTARFREDLFYRLNVFPISIAPLRERLDDLPRLAEAILTRIAARERVLAPRLSPAVLNQLRAHRWPGNVRELENVLERSRILSRGETLKLAPDFVPVSGTTRPAATDEPIGRFADWERRGIELALEATDGRIYGKGGAAELLALKPTTLQSKIRKLRIRRAAFVVKGAT